MMGSDQWLRAGRMTVNSPRLMKYAVWSDTETKRHPSSEISSSITC
jgi:hypothetical protein